MTVVAFVVRALDPKKVAAFFAAKGGLIRRAVLARRPLRLPRRARRPIDFSRMIRRVAEQHGVAAATAWTQAVLRHQGTMDLAALRAAIASKNVANIEAVVAASKLQQTAGRALRQPFTAASQAAGMQSAAILKGHGLAASFNAVHPNVVNYAREQSARLVVGVPRETKRVIAEVIALGAQYGLDVAEQARAIREVVGLPPNWVSAPLALRDEIKNGRVAAATGRRLSAVTKQQIRSRVAAGTVTAAFLDEVTETYAASLINRRALTIARTETLRATHHGLVESWSQAQAQGVLPQTARQFWILTPDERLCPVCVQIPGMNPNGRGLDEQFETPEGPVDAPPSPHPNCRCSIGLLPNVPEDFDVTESVEDDEEPLRRAVGEPESSPVLSAEEQASVLERLGGLTSGIEGGEMVVSALDVGFAGRLDFVGGNFSKARRLSVSTTVDPRALYATQDNVVIKGVQRYARKPPTELPLVAKLEDGRMMVLEGHTRLSAQILAGRTKVSVRLVGLENGKFARPLTAVRAPVLEMHVKPVRMPAGVARELGLDDPLVARELAGSGIHVEPKGAGYRVTAASRPQAKSFVDEMRFRSTDAWDVPPAARSRFGKFAERLEREWGLTTEPLRAVVRDVVVAEAQALYESAYGFLPRGRPMWNSLPDGRVRAKFLEQAQRNLAEGGTAGRLPAGVRRGRSLPSELENIGISPARVAPGSSAPSAEQHELVVKTLRGMGVDPAAVTYSDRLRKFRLGGRMQQVAGEYKNGRIWLDPRMSVDDLRTLVPHEAQHLKFDVALKTDPSVRRFVEDNFAALRREDGVTAYSREHWQAYEGQLKAFRIVNVPTDTIPVNETLAEIRAAMATGEGEAFLGSAKYRQLLKMVDDAYARAVVQGRAFPSARAAKLRGVAPRPAAGQTPLRDLAAKETAMPAEEALRQKHGSLSNYLDGVFEDNFRAQAGAELTSVDHYMSYHYGTINNSLRSGNVEKFLNKAYSGRVEDIAERLEGIKGLDKLMARMPELGENATVWRSVNNVEWLTPGKGTFEVLENARALVGTEFVDAGFVSTTTLSNAARGWSKLREGGTLVEIRLPPNTRGAWMKQVAREHQESAIVKREYLLPRGAKFKVVEARVEGGITDRSILHLIVEYVP